jgi:hypothetical protein
VARRFDRDSLKYAITLRSRVLSSLRKYDTRHAGQTASELDIIANGYRDLSSQLGELAEAETAEYFADALGSASYLCRWVVATLGASPDAQSLLEAARARCLVLQERLTGPSHVGETHSALNVWVESVLAVKNITQVSSVVASLTRIRLPVFYSRGNSKDHTRASENTSTQTPAIVKSPVVKLMFSLDGQTLATPQAIRSGMQHDLTIDLTAATWPDTFDELHVDYLSTMAAGDYYLTPFTFERSGGDRQHQKGNCIFHHPQTLLSEPAWLKVRARFTSSDRSLTLQAIVVGHTELQLRALNETSYPLLSGYPTVDIQIPKILQDAREALPDISPSDFDDFARCLIHLSRYAGMTLQSSVFKGRKISEPRDFQQHLLATLRMTELSSEVREGERTSGGILDLRYRNIVIELKVETGISDREKLRVAYLEQSAQYGSHAVPLSIACILDMTEKDHTPANIANNITLETPRLHGFEDTTPQYPSKVAVIIIDGNIKSPSDYS